MLRLFSLPLLLLCAAEVTAAPPTISLPAQINGPVGGFVSVPATTQGKTVRWLVLDPGLHLFPIDLLRDTHVAVVTSHTPGTYRLAALTAAGDEISEPAYTQVVIQASGPAPTPTPTPAPTPSPAPTNPPAWAIVVLDNQARTPAQAQLLGSPTLLPALQKAGVSLRVLDVHDPVVTANNYGPFVTEAGGVPALLLLAATGQRIKALKLPPDEASFLKEVGP